ncbi:hypothetical protein FHS98_002755 [Sphingomonas oligoaromativorans]|nr:hypothetical protein [Sphingomonas oligoaromativorans]
MGDEWQGGAISPFVAILTNVRIQSRRRYRVRPWIPDQVRDDERRERTRETSPPQGRAVMRLLLRS